MDISPWTLLTDLGFVALLLLVGSILRAKVKVIQMLFLPASLIARILGLILGPNGVGVIPFSSAIGTYPGILIAVVFASLPIAAKKMNWKTIIDRVGYFWGYSQFIMIVQWGLGVLFGLVVLKFIWPELHNGFGLMLAAGFVGGHGTAAAIGEAFSGHGWEDAASLAMTSATVGIVVAIVGGIFLINMSARKGEASFISDYKQLPNELRTGLITRNKRKSFGDDTVSSISIDPLIFHLAIILVATIGGYYLSDFGGRILPQVTLPAFSVAFIVAIFIQQVLVATKSIDYFDKRIVDRISGSATDLLVVFGIASIKLPVVIKYATPLIFLFLFGIVYCYICFKILGPRMLREFWFEKSIFSWGWMTGTMAMGIALLRIVDPDLKSKTLDDYALAYIPTAPVEILVVTFSPLLIMSGQHWLFIIITLGFGLIIFLLALMRGWWIKDINVHRKRASNG
ncbi:sodium/glutamate symporter [Pseudogracilibacillus sp. SO30301A]|uniref:sodium/glutamate symporter n=1 Tax=Pseudogracilibacillus sp. SO30301A TaxID=3098291 RepID=UPI00300E22FA